MEALGANVLDALSSKWWLFLIRGIAGILLAIIAFVSPGIALVSLVIVLGAYAFILGVLALTVGASGFVGGRWWVLVLEGILGIVAAFIIWTQPLASTVAFVYFFAAWLIFTGIMQVIGGLQLRDVVSNEWLYVLAGIVSIAFGIWVIRRPALGLVAEAFLIGWYALLFGIMQVAFSVRLRSMRASVPKAKPV